MKKLADHYGQTPSAESQLAGLGLFDGNAALEQREPVRRVPVTAHLRRVAGEPEPDQSTQRTEELAKHEEDAAKRTAIVYLRARLLELYRRRIALDANASVNADDAEDYFQAWSQCPPVLRTIPRYWKGSLFAKGWERTGGSSPSKRNHGTSLPDWRPTV